MQQKDVIYIDVEDDITAIIGKVKGAKEKIVALVPPKRTGILQSAVNLRLLARAADHADKRLVLITNNGALSGLAASAKIPVAKNLQSRPEIATVPETEADDEDVIDGEQLPVGDHAGMARSNDETIPASSVDSIDIDGDVPPPAPKRAAAGKPKAKKGIKVPDFGTFRKKAVLFAGLGVLLITFLVWAIWFAPHATVVVSAKTSDQSLRTPVTLGDDLTTDSEKTTIKSVSKEEKVSQSVDFDVTGTKDVGEKATGTVTFSTSSISDLGTTIPANTQLTTASGLSYLTTQSVTITISNYNGATAGIVASEGGTKYNGATGALSGAPGKIASSISAATAGGTDKTIKIVLQADVEKAKKQIADQNTDEIKKKLVSGFGPDVFVIDSSFTASGGDVQSSPGVGEEAASGKAKLTREMTYVMTGVPKDELNSYLDDAFTKTLTNKSQQRVYENGAKEAKFDDFKSGERTATASLSTTGQIGPRIDDEQIKELVKGKRFGEIEGDLKAIDGVSDVKLNLSPFWVQSVPNDVKKISIEFKLIKNSNNG